MSAPSVIHATLPELRAVADVRSRDNFGAGRLATLGAALRRVGHGALAAGLDTGSQRGRAIRRYLRPASEDDGE